MSQELDFLMTPVFVRAIADPNEDLMYSPPFSDEPITISSFYNVSTDKHEGNLFSMFTAVPLELWIGYLAAFFIFVSVTYLGSYIVKQPYDCLWNTICAFLDQDNYPVKSNFIAIFSIVVMVSTFFLLSYLTNSMGTDLVTVDTAIAIKSYKDILDRKIRILMIDATFEYMFLKTAKKGTLEHELFNLVSTVKDFQSPCPMYYDQSHAYLTGLYSTVQTLACINRKDFPNPNGRMLLSRDDNAQRLMTAFVMSGKWKGTDIEERLTKT